MALDLSKDVPRSPFADLDGFAWLPRLIDKARAHHAGTGGEYATYPCAGDKRFLAHFGVDADALGAQIKGGADDAAIAAWVAANAKTTTDEAKLAYRRSQHDAPGIVMRLAVMIMRSKLAGTIAAKSPGVDVGGLDTFAKVIAAEEGHPIPPRP